MSLIKMITTYMISGEINNPDEIFIAAWDFTYLNGQYYLYLDTNVVSIYTNLDSIVPGYYTVESLGAIYVMDSFYSDFDHTKNWQDIYNFSWGFKVGKILKKIDYGWDFTIKDYGDLRVVKHIHFYTNCILIFTVLIGNGIVNSVVKVQLLEYDLRVPTTKCCNLICNSSYFRRV